VVRDVDEGLLAVLFKEGSWKGGGGRPFIDTARTLEVRSFG
jgi:hypothetical protein